jgi:hypothetical protein
MCLEKYLSPHQKDLDFSSFIVYSNYAKCGAHVFVSFGVHPRRQSTWSISIQIAMY